MVEPSRVYGQWQRANAFKMGRDVFSRKYDEGPPRLECVGRGRPVVCGCTMYHCRCRGRQHFQLNDHCKFQLPVTHFDYSNFYSARVIKYASLKRPALAFSKTCRYAEFGARSNHAVDRIHGFHAKEKHCRRVVIFHEAVHEFQDLFGTGGM